MAEGTGDEWERGELEKMLNFSILIPVSWLLTPQFLLIAN